MGTIIKAVSFYLPEDAVTNERLKQENPDWQMDQIEARSGVRCRHISNESETALDLAYKACLKLFEENPEAKGVIDGIVFCTQSQDYIIPSNSCVLHGLLGLPEEVFAVDIGHACSGYVYGLSVAHGAILSGAASNLLLVTAETYSKYINPSDRSTRVLFGDGAAVSWITSSNASRGLITARFATFGRDFKLFHVPAGGCRLPLSEETARPQTDSNGNVRSMENIYMDGVKILGFVNTKVLKQIRAVLKINGLAVGDIDLYVFHQASKMVLDSLQRLLGLDPEKVFSNVAEVGNTVSASIPIALKCAMERGVLRPGHRVLISGFGAGLSWATAIVEI
jgi:3-oxoacyl-[acyl-carrier-protein] synthase-3